MGADLYGDEALFDELLRKAMMAQICERCGYEMGHEQDGTEETGVRNFVVLRFKKKCEQCLDELRAVREEKREEREHKAKEKARAAKRVAKQETVPAPRKTFTSSTSLFGAPPTQPTPKVPLDERIWDLIVEVVSKMHPSVSLEEIEARVRKAREKHEQKIGAKP